MKRKKPRFLKPGEYSSGTLRLRDIAEAEFSALGSIVLSKSERMQVIKAKMFYARLLAKSETDNMDFERDAEKPSDYDDLDFYVNEGLLYVLDAHCLPYCYWGSSAGDGACIGVHVDVELVMEEASNGEIRRMDKAEKLYRGLVVSVSDHGNVELYDRRPFGHGYKDVSLWGVV